MTQRYKVGIRFGVLKLSLTKLVIFRAVALAFLAGYMLNQSADSTFACVLQDEGQKQNQETAKSSDGKESEQPATTKEKKPKDKVAFQTARFLPQSTRAWVSVSSVEQLETALGETKFGALAGNEELKPVFENLKNQMMAWGDQQDQRFAISIESLMPFGRGEICFAGVLNNQSRHAVVMIVDVAKKLEEANKLLADAEQELVKRGATKSEEEFHGVKCQKWNFKEPKGIRERETAFFAIVADRLVMCDDQETFADVVNRLGREDFIGSLADSTSFKAIRNRCSESKMEYEANIQWFVEPFGYIKLLDQIQKKNNRDSVGPAGGNQQDLAVKLKEQGFDGVQAFGGDVWVGSDGLEMVHRGFIYAPPIGKEQRFAKAANWMLNFPSLAKEIVPGSWVPDSVASYATLRWDFKKGITGIGHLFDSFTGQPGQWKTILEGLRKGRKGLKIDVLQVAEKLDGRISIISEYLEPYTAESEKIVAGFKLKPNSEQFANDSLLGLFRRQPKYWEMRRIRGKVYWISKEPKKDVGPEFDDEDEFGDEFEDEFEKKPNQAVAEAPQEEPLFKKMVFVVDNDTLFFSNDLAYVQGIVETKNRPSLADKPDWKRVTEVMDQFSSSPDCFRQFGRISKRMRLFYELLRKNEVPRDNGLLSRLMGKIKDAPKLKKLDGKQLPADYEKSVSPYLGLAGWSLENDPNGWFFLGCILPKEENEN